jgi:hypothetical protein
VLPCPSRPNRYVETAEHATGGGYVIGNRVIMWSNLKIVFQHLWFSEPVMDWMMPTPPGLKMETGVASMTTHERKAPRNTVFRC